MLIRFSIENWMSFRDPATFSMIASQERQHRQHLIKLEKYQTNLLPIATIYGGNASGKTNLFKAIAFTRDFIVQGRQPDTHIPTQYFLLDDAYANRPSRFSFELFINEKIYEYSFAVSRESVQEEQLIEIKSCSENVLFNRTNKTIEIAEKFRKTFEKTPEKEGFLNYVAQGTRDNQLFLTNAVFQKVNALKPIYDWFKDSLTLLAPDARFAGIERFFDINNPLHHSVNNMLEQLDTGISRLGSKEVAFEMLPLPHELKTQLSENLKEGETIRLHDHSPSNDKFLVTRRKGQLVARKLVTYHRKPNGEEVEFNIDQESDGSRRLIDLLPAFVDLREQQLTKVYLFDEIDRSLHSLLIQKLLTQYLAHCSATAQTQLLLTTHNLSLMNQRWFRRDEMWVTERDFSGNTSLSSFSEYKDIRYDKDIQKSYQQGRLGGIPHLYVHES